jgi:queuine/archaeosine tRNA-ribosyltransferase
MLGNRLLSIHNLTYTLGVLAGARLAITGGRLRAYRERLAADRRTRSANGGLHS